jgi:replicative DNA helicase
MESTDRSLFYQKAVLGSVFANAAVMSTVVERVSPHMFENENLGLIFRGMVSLFNKGIGIDPLLIDREMKLLDEELYRKMGGLNYDMELFTCVLDSSNVEEYARLVKDDYLRRRLSALYMTLMSSLGDTSKDINLIVGLMYKGVEELFRSWFRRTGKTS